MGSRRLKIEFLKYKSFPKVREKDVLVGIAEVPLLHIDDYVHICSVIYTQEVGITYHAMPGFNGVVDFSPQERKQIEIAFSTYMMAMQVLEYGRHNCGDQVVTAWNEDPNYDDSEP